MQGISCEIIDDSESAEYRACVDLFDEVFVHELARLDERAYDPSHYEGHVMLCFRKQDTKQLVAAIQISDANRLYSQEEQEDYHVHHYSVEQKKLIAVTHRLAVKSEYRSPMIVATVAIEYYNFLLEGNYLYAIGTVEPFVYFLYYQIGFRVFARLHQVKFYPFKDYRVSVILDIWNKAFIQEDVPLFSASLGKHLSLQEDKAKSRFIEIDRKLNPGIVGFQEKEKLIKHINQYKAFSTILSHEQELALHDGAIILTFDEPGFFITKCSGRQTIGYILSGQIQRHCGENTAMSQPGDFVGINQLFQPEFDIQYYVNQTPTQVLMLDNKPVEKMLEDKQFVDYLKSLRG